MPSSFIPNSFAQASNLFYSSASPCSSSRASSRPQTKHLFPAPHYHFSTFRIQNQLNSGSILDASNVFLMQTRNERMCVSAQNTQGWGGQGRNERKRLQSKEGGLEEGKGIRVQSPDLFRAFPRLFPLGVRRSLSSHRLLLSSHFQHPQTQV